MNTEFREKTMAWSAESVFMGPGLRRADSDYFGASTISI